MMGLPTVPFAFGNDLTKYQTIVKDYFTTGPGSYIRPGGQYLVAWNGLDGRSSTVCPLSVNKREQGDNSPNICGLSSSIHHTSKPTSSPTKHPSSPTSITLNPTPTGSTTCNPPRSGPELAMYFPPSSATTYCRGPNPNWALGTAPNAASHSTSYYIHSGYTLAAKAPPECKQLYTPNHPDTVTQLCAQPLQRIANDCPNAGGTVSNICGTWWLKTDCPAGPGKCNIP